ncbi:MAG: adenylate kinase [Flavobacteriaceae bacterium]|nr:adenylate kinase [Flavobacteriaceae bacterium]|tara:strand:- start:29276 stop:29851 length:576 start_codon:yes stop_codon:yes gene_type:complete
MINLVLFGKPGAGKGTQAEYIKKEFGLFHISTGDLFRYNIKNKTSLGLLAKKNIDNGDLVPDHVTIEMLKDSVLKNINDLGFIFDGFPRTISQAIKLDEFLTSIKIEITATISLNVEDTILMDRLIKRGKLEGRADDLSIDKIRNRFNEYNTKTQPLLNFYHKQGKLLSIDGSGTIYQIRERVNVLVNQFK